MHINLRALKAKGFSVDLNNEDYLVIDTNTTISATECASDLQKVLDKHFGDSIDYDTSREMLGRFIREYHDRMILQDVLSCMVLGADHTIPRA